MVDQSANHRLYPVLGTSRPGNNIVGALIPQAVVRD